MKSRDLEADEVAVESLVVEKRHEVGVESDQTDRDLKVDHVPVAGAIVTDAGIAALPVPEVEVDVTVGGDPTGIATEMTNAGELMRFMMRTIVNETTATEIAAAIDTMSVTGIMNVTSATDMMNVTVLTQKIVSSAAETMTVTIVVEMTADHASN